MSVYVSGREQEKEQNARGHILSKSHTKHTEHVRFSSWWLQLWMRTYFRLNMPDVWTFYT